MVSQAYGLQREGLSGQPLKNDRTWDYLCEFMCLLRGDLLLKEKTMGIRCKYLIVIGLVTIVVLSACSRVASKTGPLAPTYQWYYMPLIQGNAYPGITPTPAPGSNIDLVQYTIQDGDTLMAIAEKFKVTVQDIATTNQISDTRIIYPGEIIVIPVLKESKPAP